MLDLHVHTHHSCDSEELMESYCIRAIDMNLSHICFTDHIDYNKADYGFGYYNMQSFFDELENVREKYGSSIEILTGAEFSEPHIYKREFEAFQKAPYDFLLGSIHFWKDDLFPSEMLKQGISAEEAFNKYWSEIKKAVSFGGFDSIAHFDFPKRYYKKLLYSDELITEIFKIMIENQISLEINTSTLRQNLDESMPDKNIVDLYKKAGGKKVTFGSDAHKACDLAAGYDYFANFVSGGMQSIVYINRRPISLKI